MIAVVYPWMVFKLREEERLLTEAFGDEYRRYRQRVPRLIPGLKGLPRR
ncbi:hypothetical protein HFP15_29090 [Amycolatopsis sp. K13G38]|uniref:Isoprenylcysteine carboxylmethyltransferase family protein n=1 Tax=Amycolatopsis acididurans TaxID=2724524 RepID=A0ABX1JB73_9PSEU|nr:hypothetical protein [Amycolatopsis acididurans]NKQ56933.1 hypothetical protein [Amycolatopsis acididurans]